MKSYKSAFELITDDPAEIKLYETKAKLMNSIVDRIKELDITQVEASEVMKVTQPRVSNLKNNRISKFTYDMLFLMNERIKA